MAGIAFLSDLEPLGPCSGQKPQVMLHIYLYLYIYPFLAVLV